MPFCKTCGKPFDWGWQADRWVMLEPTDRDRDLDRRFVDENGRYRADHRDRCVGESVNVTRLDKAVRPEELGPEATGR